MQTQPNVRSDDDEPLNEIEAAKFLRKSVATLRRWRGMRVGPAYCKPPHTKAPLYFKRDLRASIEAGRIEPVAARKGGSR